MNGSPGYFSEADSPELLALLGSTVSEPILDGRHKLFRSIREDRAVVVKMTVEPLDPDAIASLRHEYELLRALSVPGVVKVLGLARAGEGLALIMEDAGRQNLGEKLGSGPLSVPEFLEIALQLAEAVAGLHEARIVHRDIGPSNIVWDAESRRATLVDFGIATTLSALTVTTSLPSRPGARGVRWIPGRISTRSVRPSTEC